MAKAFMALFPKGKELQAVIDKNAQTINKKTTELQKLTANIPTIYKTGAARLKTTTISRLLKENSELFQTSRNIAEELRKLRK